MSDDRNDPLWTEVRDSYNVPGETPRDAMWAAISDGLMQDSPTGGAADVVDIGAARGGRPLMANQAMGWAVAAAAVLVLGIGIGRITVPRVAGGGTADMMTAAPASLTLAAREHLGRSESLLAMVRADARAGRVDPMTAEWAKAMLGQTRILIDVQGGGDPAVSDLLLDLELVLAQIVGVAETGSMDEGQARTELELALRSLEDGEVLPRIQAVLPNAFEGD